jgi:hypothetical protein
MSELSIPVIQLLSITAQGRKQCRTQDCLRDEEIVVDLYSDNLSGVLDDIFSDSENESERECLPSDSDSEKTSDKSDDSSNTRNVGTTKWAKKR